MSGIPADVPPADVPTSSMASLRPLRAAVVGAGAFGRHHARIYTELAELGIRLVGIVDPGSDAPRELAQRFGVPQVAQVDELPEVPDLVSVAVPTTLHRVVAEPLLRRGIHCLIEKPLASCGADAEALVAAAAAGGACLQVGHVERFNPVLAAADRLEQAPVYIEVHRLAPYRARTRDVGVVMDLMIHDLEILNHLVGEEARDVSAVLRTDHGGGEDVAQVRLVWPSGCVAHVTASRVADERVRQLRIFTPASYLRLDLDKPEAHLGDAPAEDGWEAYWRGQAARPAGLTSVGGELPSAERALALSALPVESAEPLKAELEAFAASVRGGARPLVGGREGWRALALAERILGCQATS